MRPCKWRQSDVYWTAGHDRPIPVTGTILSDRPKSMRSFLGHMTLVTGNSLSTFQKSLLRPSSSYVVLFYVFCVCVCTVLVIVARGGSGGWGTALQAGGSGFDYRGVLLWCKTAGRGLIGHRLATAWVKVLRLCLQMTNETDLLEAAITLIVT